MKSLDIGTNNVTTRRTRALFAILLGIMTIFGGLFYSVTNATAADTVSLVVKLVDGLSPTEQAAVIARNGGVETSSVPALRLHVVTVPTADQPLVQQNYQADAQVVSVEVNKTRKAEAIPTDANYGVQWALSKIGWESVFGTVAPTGTAILALLDTGVDATHPDLAGNVIPGTSVLDGTNGLSDPSGHGTWLAGIVAAATDNGTGIAGVAFGGVQVMPVSVLNAGGTGQDSDIIAGIVWAVDHGADVILMGFSNPDFSQNLQDAIDYAWSKGAVLVAATGNDGVITPTFPAGDRGVIGVSATDPNDLLAPTSNYGQDTFLAAPGTDIYTTGLNGGYSYISGTSASSALVAGAAAFMKSVDPTLTNGIIVGRLARAADAIGTAGDPNNPAMFGNGRLNMAKALAETGIDPVQPAGTPGGGGPFVGPYVAAACSLTLTPASGPIDTKVSVTSGGGCFTGGANVNISFDGIQLATCKANNGGNIPAPQTTCMITVPSSASVGDHTVSASGTTKTATFSVNKTQITPSFTASNKIYDGTTDATVTFTGFTPSIGTDNVSVTYTSATFANETAANGKTVTISGIALTGTDAYKYTLSSTTATITADIAKANANITVTPYDVTYDGAAHTATGTASGVEATPADLSSLLTLSGTTHTDAGDYPDDAWSFAGNGNYNAASGTVHDKIAKANANIAVTPYDVTYNGTAHTATGTATGVEATPADLSSLLTLSGTTHTDAGDYPADAWSFAGNDNYNTASGTVHDKIAKANANIVVTPYDVTYDGAAHTATGTATGVEATPADLSSLLTLSGTTHTDAGDYPADVWSFAGNDNYNTASGTVHDKIAKANANIVVTPYDVTYDGTAHTATGTATGVEATPADLSSLLTLSGTTHTDAGDYPADTWGFAGNDNYNTASGTVNDKIAKASAKINVVGWTGTYDGNAHGASGSAEGVKGEDLSASLNLGTKFTDYPGGTAHWSFVGGTNYNDVNDDVTIVINKANAIFKVIGWTGNYDAAAHGASGPATGVGEVDLSASLNLGAKFTDVPGGTAHWTFSGGTNYNDASGDVAIVINKVSATINVIGWTGTYDTAPHGATGTAKGVGGVDLNAGLNLGSAFTNVPGGIAHWTFTGGTNYNDASGDMAIVINKKGASVTPTATSKILGAAEPAFTGTLVGFLPGDNVTVIYSRTAGEAVGAYTISATLSPVGVLGNYDITYKTAMFNITYKWTGFLQPINDTAHQLSTFSSFKSGQTIPAKFVLQNAAGIVVQQTGNPTFTRSGNLGACSSYTTVETVEVVAADTIPEYKWDGSQYHYNWSTKNLSSGIYRISANLADGTVHSVDICLTK